MGIRARAHPIKKAFSTVLGEIKGFGKKLNTKLLRVVGRKEKAREVIALTESDLSPSKEMIKFASTMVELRLVREYNEYLSQEFHDLYEARTSRPSTSMNFPTVASTVRSEISWRFWRELDTPTTLTTFSATLEEEYLPHIQTPWTNEIAQAARSLGIPINVLILEIEDYASHFTNSTTVTLPRQSPSIEFLIENGHWENLAQRLARDMLVADITFTETEDRMKRVSLKEAIERCRKDYFEVLRTEEDGTVRWYPTPMTNRKMEIFAKGSLEGTDSDGASGGQLG